MEFLPIYGLAYSSVTVAGFYRAAGWFSAIFAINTINTEKYKKILYELGTEQDEDYSWIDQDIYEQLRKMIKDEKN